MTTLTDTNGILCSVSLYAQNRLCDNKATRRFEYAPHGTADPERRAAKCCTRHFNAIVHGKGRYNGYTYIVTSPKA